MIVRRVTAYAVKAGKRYEMSGNVSGSARLPGTDYIRFGSYPQLYAELSQAALVKVETEDGVVGWGEAQAPIAPEVILAIVSEMLGPAILGKDALDTGSRFWEMYETLRVRGQTGGFQVDAIAALDTALWDIKGQVLGSSVADLLGGRMRDSLPCYVTGLREKSAEGRREEAAKWAQQGIGVKPCLGLSYRADVAEVEGLREAVGDEGVIFVDGMWAYDVPEATRVGRALEGLGVGFFESPLVPEDIRGHAVLADKLDMAVAVGEPLRTTYAFLPWLQQDALDIAQPDLMRNGVTNTVKIAQLAEVFHRPVALHTGCLTVIGMSATWQVASTLPNFHVQEYQPVMLDLFNPWLNEPLRVHDGMLQVPTRPGLGLELDEAKIVREASSEAAAAL